MSISAAPIGGTAIAAQDATTTTSTSTNKPPKRRQIVAKVDTIAQPEAR